jgi:hypothetical protein
MTIYHGLNMTMNLGYSRIVCYSNSQTMLDLVSKDHNHFHCYVSVIASIEDLLKLKRVLSFLILSEGNFSVDFLTNLGSTNDDKFIV